MADKDKFGFSDKAYGKALADAAKKGGDGKGKAFQKLDQEALEFKIKILRFKKIEKEFKRIWRPIRTKQVLKVLCLNFLGHRIKLFKVLSTGA